MNRVFTLQGLLQAQRKPLLIVDAECRIAGVNPALEQALEQESGQLPGQACCQLDADRETDCRHRRFFRDLEPYVETRTLVTPDGTLRNAQVQGFPLMDCEGRLFLGESVQPLDAPPTTDDMVGRSDGFQMLRQRLAQAAATDAPVLLLGETGSGKELAAQFLHRHSPRAAKPFVVVDCTVLNEELFESELFGHVKGAFTGAASNKTGLFELADGGTLFLDEIGELPLSQQPKLLRALESGSFRPVGATRPRSAQVRVVSATHRDMQTMVAEKAFRQDLYFRLAVLPLELPPLRRRREDIPALAEHLLQDIGRGGARNYRLQRDALRKLLLYDFPGNVRELRNLLHLGATLSPGGEIGPEQIQLPERPREQPQSAAAPGNQAVLPQIPGLSPVETAEAGYIMDLMHRFQGSRKQVAANMNVSERTLYRKLKRYGLNRPNEQSDSGH